jgi:hypothetical protein
MTIDEYLAECQRLCGDRWEECSEAYSFEAASDEMTPSAAVLDCIAWLDQK